MRQNWVWGTRWLLAAMLAFQLAWLVIIALTNSARHGDKIPFLLAYSLVVGAVFLFMPAALVARLETFGRGLLRNPRKFLLLLGILAAVLGVVYARFQGIWEYDEEMSLAASEFLAKRGPILFFANYMHFDWLGPQHPPLMMFPYAAMMQIFGTDPFFPRLVPVVLMVLTLVLTWVLAGDLYDRTIGIFAAALLLAFPLIVRQGSAAMLDMVVTFYFTLAMWLVVRLRQTANIWLAIGIGVTIGAALLTKYAMFFIFPVLFVLVVTQREFWRLKWQFVLIGVIGLACLGFWLVSANRAGILDGQIARISFTLGLSQRSAAERTETATDSPSADLGGKVVRRFLDERYHALVLETLVTRLPSAIGPYNLPLLAVGLWAVLKRRRSSDAFILIWIVVVSLGLVLSLPDHRYFMPVFPALAMLMARGLEWNRPGAARAIPLALCLNVGALYLFVDWTRTNLLFDG